MTSKISLRVPFALAIAAALAATPALAQKGHGHGHDKQQDRVERRDDDHADRRRRDDDDRNARDDRNRRSDGTWRSAQNIQYGQNGSRPGDRHPGWCTGRGNPHNTVANCGRGADRYDPRYDTRRNGSYGNRNPTVYRNGSGNGTYGSYGTYNGNPTVYRNGSRTGTYSNGSYTAAHDAFHRQQARECSAAAAQRRNDRSWQLRVASQCNAQHQAWHNQYDARTRR